MQRLYSAVSLEELADTERHDKLHALPNHMDGKHFATTSRDAREFGRGLYPYTNFAILYIDVPANVVRQMYYWEMLDTIGPAYFATMDQLEGIKVHTFAVCEVPHE
jgi:hypothetical protein